MSRRFYLPDDIVLGEIFFQLHKKVSTVEVAGIAKYFIAIFAKFGNLDSLMLQ
jgi:hypothetical protein